LILPKFLVIVESFTMGLALKVGEIHSRGSRVMEV